MITGSFFCCAPPPPSPKGGARIESLAGHWEWCPGTIVDEARTSLFGETVVLWTIRYDSKFGGKVSAKPCAVQIAVT